MSTPDVGTSHPGNAALALSPAGWAWALLAIVAPTLIAAHDPPSVTFYNQALAGLGAVAGLDGASARWWAGSGVQTTDSGSPLGHDWLAGGAGRVRFRLRAVRRTAGRAEPDGRRHEPGGLAGVSQRLATGTRRHARRRRRVVLWRAGRGGGRGDRKSTPLNSSHRQTSHAPFRSSQ